MHAPAPSAACALRLAVGTALVRRAGVRAPPMVPPTSCRGALQRRCHALEKAGVLRAVAGAESSRWPIAGNEKEMRAAPQLQCSGLTLLSRMILISFLRMEEELVPVPQHPTKTEWLWIPTSTNHPPNRSGPRHPTLQSSREHQLLMSMWSTHLENQAIMI